MAFSFLEREEPPQKTPHAGCLLCIEVLDARMRRAEKNREFLYEQNAITLRDEERLRREFNCAMREAVAIIRGYPHL